MDMIINKKLHLIKSNNNSKTIMVLRRILTMRRMWKNKRNLLNECYEQINTRNLKIKVNIFIWRIHTHICLFKEKGDYLSITPSSSSRGE